MVNFEPPFYLNAYLPGVCYGKYVIFYEDMQRIVLLQPLNENGIKGTRVVTRKYE